MPGNDTMVDRLVRRGLLESEPVVSAFRQVDRSVFCKTTPYVDSPQPIGSGQTISAPHMVAIMSEAIELRSGMNVLEIGTGSGYQAAILAILAHPGTVHTVERVPELAAGAREALGSSGIENVVVHTGDGSGGLPEKAPFDRVLVACGAPSVPPPLPEQLSEDGVLLIPVGQRFQELFRLRRGRSGFLREKLGGCIFVPLTGKYGVDGT